MCAPRNFRTNCCLRPQYRPIRHELLDLIVDVEVVQERPARSLMDRLFYILTVTSIVLLIYCIIYGIIYIYRWVEMLIINFYLDYIHYYVRTAFWFIIGKLFIKENVTSTK